MKFKDFFKKKPYIPREFTQEEIIKAAYDDAEIDDCAWRLLDDLKKYDQFQKQMIF